MTLEDGTGRDGTFAQAMVLAGAIALGGGITQPKAWRPEICLWKRGTS